MHISLAPGCSMFFGASKQSPDAQFLDRLKKNNNEAAIWEQNLSHTLGISRVIFLHQTHSNTGYVFHAGGPVPAPWSLEGDLLLTDQPRLGLGILTADCLPIVFYEPERHVVAIAHAGWPGSVNGIGLEVIARMKTEYGAEPERVIVTFGPCAQKCCYEVSLDFKEKVLEAHPWAGATFELRQGKVYFDLIRFNKELMMRTGLTEKNFYPHCSPCTICDPSYYSYRRSKEAAGRNISIVWLA